MSNIQNLNIRPKASIYEMFSRLNYKTWYAIAEFVDNSTASFFKNRRALKMNKINDVHIDITYNEAKNTLKIVDDAYGMDLEDFKTAILLDAKPIEQGSRNEFGKGLKTAASWFGQVWHVKSTRLGDNHMYETTVDIPYIKENDLETVQIIPTLCDPKKHGTEIFIEKLTKNMSGGNTKKKIKAVLSSMYRRDLKTGHVFITFNGEKLDFKPYEVLSKSGKECRKNLDFTFKFDDKEHHITGFVGILGGNDSGYTKAGFALFRRERVVIGSEGEYYKPLQIFRQAQSTISHKLFGELNLDDFDINQAKDGFVWDGGLEDAFIEKLKEQIKDYIQIANLTIKVRDANEVNHSKETVEEVTEIAQKGFDSASEGEKENQLTGDQEVDSFAETFLSEKAVKDEIYEDSKHSYSINADQFTKMDVDVIWADAVDKYWYKFDSDKNLITINIGHPFFKPYSHDSKFKALIDQFVVSIFLAERYSEQTANEEGYIQTNTLDNFINKFLGELKN